MYYSNIRKKQLWETPIAIIFVLISVLSSVLAYFGGNFENPLMQKTELLWWVLYMITAMLCRRYFCLMSTLILLLPISLCSFLGLILKKGFIPSRKTDFIIYVFIAIAVYLVAFLPAFDFFEYEEMKRLWYKYIIITVIGLFISWIASSILYSALSMLTVITV